MQFVDQARIFVSAGDGGDGAVSYRREKFVPAGGPDGGNGGQGGSVIIAVDPGKTTLLDFRYRRHYKAERGENGRGKRQHGRNASDLVVKVPPGTVVYNDKKDQVFADLTGPRYRLVAAAGGRGGRGNAVFTTPTRRTPTFAENGEVGESRWLRLELKLIADVGLVGYPNAGKSTLLSVISAARPKIASYPFTTLAPNLGVVEVETGKSFVAADIPGLIEGAHAGVGLGHDFLRHIERTRLLVHVVDCSGMEGRDPIQDFYLIREELRQFDDKLALTPYIVVGNKLDLPDSKANLARLAAAAGKEVIGISAVTKQGVSELIYKMWHKLAELASDRAIDEHTESADGKDEPITFTIPTRRSSLEDFRVVTTDEGFALVGDGLEQFIQRHDLSNHETLQWLMRLFREIGIIDALEKAGVEDGDIIQVGEWEFEYLV